MKAHQKGKAQRSSKLNTKDISSYIHIIRKYMEDKNKYDTFSRFQKKQNSGRGELSGRTKCPLCDPQSKKVYAIGRGLSAHLKSVHTPWAKPQKSQMKNRQKMQNRVDWMTKRILLLGKGEEEEEKRETLQKNIDSLTKILSYGDRWTIRTQTRTGSTDPKLLWDPIQEDVDEWGKEVMRLSQAVSVSLDENDDNNINQRKRALSQQDDELSNKRLKLSNQKEDKVPSYRDSLPPFILAAANGDLATLKKLFNSAENKRTLLEALDRNGSTAEHWAAGGGHTDCLLYLIIKSKNNELVLSSEEKQKIIMKRPKLKKRRDGKTPFHYAARNGKIECLELLLNEYDGDASLLLNQKSGDGTTPFHMACYGGDFATIKYLTDTKVVDIFQENDWACDASHWIAMSLNQNDILRNLDYLLDKGIDFTKIQKQGHSALHKASQKLNYKVIQWLHKNIHNGKQKEREQMSQRDLGGNKPSEILEEMGGEVEFVEWMKSVGF